MRKPARSLDLLVRGSLPSLRLWRLSARQQELLERLPADYRRFVESHNGGCLDELTLSFDTGVPFRTKDVDNPSRNDCACELFGFRPESVADDAPADLVAERDHHDEERFLPSNMIVIARCIQSSLVCLSLRRNDFGSIYYWDFYWQYPWCKWFFDERIAAAAKRYPDARRIASDEAHPLHQELFDALNLATLIPLAASFTDWIGRCYDASGNAGTESSADDPGNTSDWYRYLAKIHGDRLVLGPAPHRVDDGFWISSKSEAEPTSEEFERFYEGLNDRLHELKERRLPGVDSLDAAHLSGDFFGCRTEEILFDPKVYKEHVAVFVEAIDLVQRYLAQQECRHYRVGYFDPSGSLVIYPEAVFVGQYRFHRAQEATSAMARWLGAL